MKAVGDDVQFGTPAKKRSRRIGTINRGVTERMCLITTDTYLRTLSIAVAPNSRKLIVTNWRLHVSTIRGDTKSRLAPCRGLVQAVRICASVEPVNTEIHHTSSS